VEDVRVRRDEVRRYAYLPRHMRSPYRRRVKRVYYDPDIDELVVKSRYGFTASNVRGRFSFLDDGAEEAFRGDRVGTRSAWPQPNSWGTLLDELLDDLFD
jgi:hypothetical protein